MLLTATLALALQLPVFAPVPPDTARALRRAARRAESQYESVSRRLVPFSFGGSSSEPCDEVVGRFCLHYDTPEGQQKPIEPENRRITEVRREAVETFRRAFAALPGEIAIVAPLVRYLVEDERAGEAAAAARTFAWISGDSLWGPLLKGFAQHAASNTAAAEVEFDRALANFDNKERSRATSLDPLLSRAERTLYRKLSDAERVLYEHRFWTLSDALYITPGNEPRAEHFARYVWSRMLEKAPVVASMTSWGRDLEELTVRYGVPRARYRESAGALNDSRLIERFDPASVAVTPDSLMLRGFMRAPDPGQSSDIESPRARAGYVAPSVRRIVPLQHQISRFMRGDSLLLRADGALLLDSAARAVPGVRATLFTVDTLYNVRNLGSVAARVNGDTARFTIFGHSPREAMIYSLEALDSTSRLAGRARYAFAPRPAGTTLRLSDIVVAEPFHGALPRSFDDERLRGRARLLLDASETIGVYAEAGGITTAADSSISYDVELTLNRLDAPAALSSAVQWLGGIFGRSERSAGARVAWRATAEPGSAAVVAVDVNLATMRPGLYDLIVNVRSGGAIATSARRIRILPPRKN